MKKTLCIATAFLGSFLHASAQNLPKAQGYLLFAPGAGSDIFGGDNGRATIHIAGGGEGFIYKGLGVGAEIGPLMPWSAPRGGSTFGNYRLVGLGSANLSYHFLTGTADRTLEPFVMAGYSVFFRMGSSQGYNVGVGTNVWLKKSVAMRFDVRYHSSWRYKNMGVGMV